MRSYGIWQINEISPLHCMCKLQYIHINIACYRTRIGVGLIQRPSCIRRSFFPASWPTHTFASSRRQFHHCDHLIFRPRRSRQRHIGYSHQTFPWTICRSVGRSVRVSDCQVHCEKNGGSDPDAVWHQRSDGSRDEAGGGVCGSVHVKG